MYIASNLHIYIKVSEGINKNKFDILQNRQPTILYHVNDDDKISIDQEFMSDKYILGHSSKILCGSKLKIKQNNKIQK